MISVVTPLIGSGQTLSLKLNTIESVTATSLGMWAPIVRQQPRIKYTATIVSEDGSPVFTFDDERDDESLDTLTKKIAERVSDRVVRCYK
jgi:hypothetical protein